MPEKSKTCKIIESIESIDSIGRPRDRSNRSTAGVFRRSFGEVSAQRNLTSRLFFHYRKVWGGEVPPCKLRGRIRGKHGGRRSIRLKAPRGGPPPPHHPWKISADVVRLQKSIDRNRPRVPRKVLGTFLASFRHTWPKSLKISKKSTPEPRKSSPGASKIEPGALQDTIF